VTGLKQRSGSVTLITASQQVVKAKKVLLATGAYTNQLLDYPLALTNKPRTILLAELSTAEVERLKKIPTLIYKHIPRLATPSIYMLPPIKYPDGKYYLKIGGGYAHPMTTINTPDQLRGWFQAGGSQAEAEALKAVLSSLIVELHVQAFHRKPCVTAYTPQGYPFIDTLEDDRLFVAVGGCGAAAKSSNELGRVAAMLVMNNAWDYDLDQTFFRGG
jgi:sarcosine oxidase